MRRWGFGFCGSQALQGAVGVVPARARAWRQGACACRSSEPADRVGGVGPVAPGRTVDCRPGWRRRAFNAVRAFAMILLPITALHSSTIGMIWIPMVAAEYAGSGELVGEPAMNESELMTPDERKSARQYILSQQARMALCLAAFSVAAVKLL